MIYCYHIGRVKKPKLIVFDLAGTTVTRGLMGFGKTSRLHTAKLLRLSLDLPIVIEIVDSEERINAFLSELKPMIGGGLVTLEPVKVVSYNA